MSEKNFDLDAVEARAAGRWPTSHDLADAAAEVRRLRVKLDATAAVLGWREKEILDLKGPCSNRRCRLHYAHSGPCDAVHR